MTTTESQILLALFIDWLVGDPRNLVHPVRLMGHAANFLERITLSIVQSRRLAGMIAVAILLALTLLVTFTLTDTAYGFSTYIGFIISAIIIYTGIAARDLHDHAMNVYWALESGNLSEARNRVGMICGRDTQDMDQEAIIKATVESVAENLVDGVTGPIFYAFIGGPVLIMVYKAISTLDSMFGYKNERYIDFGWASARLDDLAAFIPSRLTALTIPIASLLVGMKARDSWRIFLRDRSKHPSPNAGQTESAFAGALGIQLGGPSFYGGVLSQKQTLGDKGEPLRPDHIRKALRLMVTTMILFCAVMMLLV